MNVYINQIIMNTNIIDVYIISLYLYIYLSHASHYSYCLQYHSWIFLWTKNQSINMNDLTLQIRSILNSKLVWSYHQSPMTPNEPLSSFSSITFSFNSSHIWQSSCSLLEILLFLEIFVSPDEILSWLSWFAWVRGVLLTFDWGIAIFFTFKHLRLDGKK